MGRAEAEAEAVGVEVEVEIVPLVRRMVLRREWKSASGA